MSRFFILIVLAGLVFLLFQPVVLVAQTTYPNPSEGYATSTPARNPTSTPYPSVLPGPTTAVNQQVCSGGHCNNGYYCCINRDNSAACCPIGDVDPTNDSGDQGNNTPTPIPTPTLTPGKWLKIKDGSFISSKTLTQLIPLSPVAYDSDDNALAYFLIGTNNTDGVVLAPMINLTLSNPNAKTSPREYFAQYNPNTSFTINGFLNYLKSRKEVKTINNLDQIISNGIYQIDNLNIDSLPNILNQYHLLIIVNNQTNINSDFNPTKSIAIVSNEINFSSSVTQAKGIFIANQINTGSTTNQGLKIIGNLVALTSLNNQRQWSDTNRPSLFVVYKPQLYLDLLPYLSTSYYDWQQIE